MRELTLRCDCGTHHLDLTVYEDEDSYLISTAYGPNRLRQRLWDAWKMVRGNTVVLSEVILTPDKVKALATFLHD